MGDNKHMKQTTLVKVEIVNAGMYEGCKLVDVKRFVSWARRGLVKGVKGKTPFVELNAYKFEIKCKAA